MQKESFFFNCSPDFKYLNVISVGFGSSMPGYTYGPIIRDSYYMSYVKNGKGTIRVNDVVYYLNQGDIFFAFPGDIYSHTVDVKEPWKALWVCLNGDMIPKYLELAGIEPKFPVLILKNNDIIINLLDELLTKYNNNLSDELFRISIMHTLFSHIISLKHDKNVDILSMQQETQNIHVQMAIDYIRKNYSKKIKLDDIANHVGLEKKYFSKLFKKATQTTPWDLILNIRAEKATILLSQTDILISSIASSVGFDDPAHFTKIFKKSMGVTPVEYRNKFR